MSFSLFSSATEGGKVSLEAMVPSYGSVTGLMPPIYIETTTERIEIRDSAGALTGYDDVTSGFGYTSTVHYDADLNYCGSDYVDDCGYRSSSTQTTLKNTAGTITGYRVTSSGGNDDYSYAANEEYDADWCLLDSSYSDSNGYAAETRQTTLTDSSGNVTGYAITSSGGDTSSQYSSTAEYDAGWNLIESNYSDSSGYQSSYRQTPLVDANGKVVGYQATGSGSGEWGSYSSTDLMDANYMLLSSSYSDSSGYHSTYALEIETDANGKIAGYVTTSTWSHGEDNFSSTNHYDADWNWLDGTDLPVMIDDGPMLLPVLTLTPIDLEESLIATLGGDDDAAAPVTDTPGSADQLAGSVGNDVFVVSDRTDRITSRGGDDTVVSSDLSLNLGRSAFYGVLNAGLLGSEDLNLTGNDEDNTLSGNAGDNRIAGMRGADSLFGGGGQDIFVLDKHNLDDADTLIDFQAGTDLISLSHKAFSGLEGKNGQLAAAAWGTTLRYDADSGALIYNTGADEVTIALIGEVAGLNADSFTFH